MASITEVLKLCRLCLMKDEVNTPIFEDVNDISQVFLKISTCLPLKVSRDDNLPKNICDNCSYKLELFYEFLHTCTASEKQLITWLNRLGVENLPVPKVINTLPSSHISNVGSVILKQEVPEFMDSHSVDDITPDDLHISSEAQDYVLQQQQQLPYEAVELEFQQENFMDTQPTTNVRQTATVSSKALKRKRPTAGLKVIPSSLDSEDDEDDIGLTGSKLTKTEEDNSDNDADDTAFVDLPSTSGENDQPGPSGVGKVAADASFFLHYLPPVISIEEKPALTLESEKNVRAKTKRKQEKPSKVINEKPKDEKNSENEELEEVAKDLTFLCHICKLDKKFTEKELRLHFKVEHKGRRLRKIHEEEPVECDICSKQYKTLKSLKEHITRHNKQFNCDGCSSHFRSLLGYTVHLRLHSQDDEFKCIMCEFNTESINDITTHINKVHNEDYRYTCKLCGKGFHVFSWYEEHANEHTGAKPFECDVCGKQFPYSRYLIAHKQAAHKNESGDSPTVHECVICKKQYQHRNSLKLHMNIHTGNVEICDICGKKLSSREKLKFHMRTHTGYKPFTCTFCGKCFTKKPILIEHQRIHTGEKPYCCEFCYKGFSQRSSMVIHMRGHTGEKPYVCHLCNKGFVARAMLNIHFRTCRGYDV